ncbi:hypothetical protein [Streptomyces sp. HB2AG]|uniref:hypothetical protein n=1 Tax=Streptomyces sp. HB2AG TaxID=2983400 RepID=UPI003FA7B1EB
MSRPAGGPRPALSAYPAVTATAADLPDRKQERVRQMLVGPHPAVPADLAERAARRGGRILRRRRAAGTVFRLLLLAAAATAVVLAVAARLRAGEPALTTPPPEGW